MTTSTPTAGFSLLDEPWIPVLDMTGQRRDVSLLGLFEQATDIQMLACELPTQNFAILRLALAVLHRATNGPPGEAAWRALWQQPQLPLTDIADYLNEFRDRFDLLHPTRPFYQVADLRAGSDKAFGLERIIADVPNGEPYLTSRTGPAMQTMTPAEAAIWLVHCQAFDPSGIKTGAVGDPRVKGGKGYPLGVASAGGLGAVWVEGATFRETLLLNLVPEAPGLRQADDRDVPVWEREPHTAVEEPASTRGPYGVLSLYTWQSRRMRLFGDRAGITGAIIAYGDILEWQDRHLMEPMSVWGRSGPREQKLKRAPVYLPRPHPHDRALWRGLQTLLPPPPPGNEPSQRLSPMVLQWLARLRVAGVIGLDFQVRSRATSITYGSNQSVIDAVFGDALTMNVLVLVEGSPLRTTAVDAAADAEAAVKTLHSLAANLIRAAGGSDTGAADRATEQGYALLDQRFRTWLARLGPATDPVAARTAWQRSVRKEILDLGDNLVESASPAAWVGRILEDRNGKQVHYCSAQAEAWFRSSLSRALPMATVAANQPREVLQ